MNTDIQESVQIRVDPRNRSSSPTLPPLRQSTERAGTKTQHLYADRIPSCQNLTSVPHVRLRREERRECSWCSQCSGSCGREEDCKEPCASRCSSTLSAASSRQGD